MCAVWQAGLRSLPLLNLPSSCKSVLPSPPLTTPALPLLPSTHTTRCWTCQHPIWVHPPTASLTSRPGCLVLGVTGRSAGMLFARSHLST